MLTRFCELSKKHLLAIVFAVLTGTVIVAPQIIFILHEGDNYRGLYMMETEAETHYLARMHEFYDEGRIGNPYLFEHKYYGPQFFPSLAEIIVAAPGKLFGISIPTLNLIDKFALPAIAFLLIYALLFRLTGHRGWSIAAGLGVILGNALLYADALRELLHLNFVYDQFVYNRPVNPQFSEILFFGYLHVLLSCHEKKSWRWFGLLGALFALSFYTYFFSFTFFLALNGVFFLLWLWRGENVLAKKMLMTSVFGIAVGSFALAKIYAAIHHPDYANFVSVNSISHGRVPEVSKNGLLVYLLFAGSVLFLKKRKALPFHDEQLFFLSGLLITTLVVINQQVLTGVAIQSGHFHWVFNVPIFMCMLMIIGWLWSNYFSRAGMLKKAGAVLPWLCSILFITTGVVLQSSSYHHWAPIEDKKQRLMPALDWLDQHTPKDSVVMANEQLSGLIPVFTHDNIMWEDEHIFCCYLVPPERAAFTPKTVLNSPDFLTAIKKYRVDYIVWDRRSDPDWAIDRFRLPLLFVSDGLEIYQLPG